MRTNAQASHRFFTAVYTEVILKEQGNQVFIPHCFIVMQGRPNKPPLLSSTNSPICHLHWFRINEFLFHSMSSPVCKLIASSHAWEVSFLSLNFPKGSPKKFLQLSLLLEIFPPVIVILFVVRISSAPSHWVWVILVCHANLSFWGIWLLHIKK